MEARGKVVLSIALLTVVGCLAGDVPSAFAAVYRYVDKSGQPGFADNLQSVPEPYRAAAVLISGEAKEGGPALSGTAAGRDTAAASPQAAVQDPRTDARAGMPLLVRLALSIAVVIAAIVLSVFLGKIGALHDHDKALHILRVALSWLIVVYLAAAHAKDVVTAFTTARGRIQAVSEESAQKGEKAARAIKGLEGTLEQAAQETERSVREADPGSQK